MSRKVLVELVDDTNGETAEETVLFGLDGVSYEIDLTANNAAMLREAITPWVESGRRLPGRKQASRSGAVPTQVAGATAQARREQLQAIRRWAKKNGYQVSSRGRIPQDVQTAYLRDTKG